MIKNLNINENLEKYIRENSYDLHPVQKDIIEYNNSLGNQKKMQISVTQSYFFQFLIKTNNIKNILEIGTFTGFSALAMALSLPKDGKITCLDKNEETSKKAISFFKISEFIALWLRILWKFYESQFFFNKVESY